jgi:hypothetical protein
VSLLGLVGVRIIPGCDGYPVFPSELVRVDVGVTGRGGWCVGFSMHVHGASPLELPRNAVGLARGVNPHELLLELRKLADAIERHL